MDRKEDKRNLNTKMELANAFKELAKKKQMNKISVRDLISYCQVNRNTFYYHFQDIYDLMDWIFDQEVKIIVGNLDKTNPKILLNKVFDYVENNKHIIHSAYNSFGREKLKELLHPHFYETFDIIITNKIKESNISIDDNYKKFLIEFYSEGIAGSIINYFKGTQNLSRETIIKYLLSLNKSIPINFSL